MTNNEQWAVLSGVLLWLLWPRLPKGDTEVKLRVDDPAFPEIDGDPIGGGGPTFPYDPANGRGTVYYPPGDPRGLILHPFGGDVNQWPPV